MTMKLQRTALLLAALGLAGCGSHAPRRIFLPQPKLPRAVAEQLANLSDGVAQKLDRGDLCGAHADAIALHSQAIAALAGGQVAPALRAPLTSATSRLVSQLPPCSPPPKPSKEHGNGKHKGHKHGEGD